MSNDVNKIIFSMVRVNKFYDKRPVIRDISLSFFYGAKIGVLGLNGSGKSTLLRIIAGKEQEYNGEVVFSPGYTIGLLEQEPFIDDKLTVKEVVQEGLVESVKVLDEYNKISEMLCSDITPEEMEKLIEKQAGLQEKIESLDAWNLDSQLEYAMDALGCPSGDTPVKTISGGERRRVALCRLLLQKPDILLLDEPTNHLDAESVAWLERHLKEYKGTVIAVTHDRYFLDNVAGWILELDRGHGIPWKGNYSSWLEQKENRLRVEEKTESDRQKTLKRELEWISMSPKARQAKGKSRIKAYENMLCRESEARMKDLEIFIPPGPRLGDIVIDFNNVSKSFGEKLLVEDISFSFPPGAIIGIIGANGAGKTTLFKMITGQEKPDKGEIKIGETVKLAYVDQSRESLEPGKTIWESISGVNDIIYLGKHEMNSRAYVARFNFSGQDQQKKVEVLSGGERNRVHLANILKEGANILLLDEPTNDLDVNTMRALEEAIENFAGCAIIISHDRWFLDRVATHILAFEGDSKIVFSEGNFTDYEERKKERLGKEYIEPHRIRYKALTRN